MRNALKCSAVLLMFVSLFAQAASQKNSAAPSSAVKTEAASGPVTPGLAEAYFQRMFGYEPDLSIQVVKVEPSVIPGLTEVTALFVTPQGQQVNKWYVSNDLKHVIVGEMLPFGTEPFADVRKKLEGAASGPSKGPADAKLMIVEFADLECPACKEAAPLMDKLRADFPQARFIFQNFPLPQHPWAAKAAGYVDCMGRANADQAFTFIDSAYAHQKEIEDAVRKTGADGKTTVDNAAVTEQLNKYTSEAGADPAKIAACAATPEISERILRSEELGREVGVTSTPTLFVNGRRVANFANAPYEALKDLATFELGQAK